MVKTMENMQTKLQNLDNELLEAKKKEIEDALSLKKHHRSIFLNEIDACDESQSGGEERMQGLKHHLTRIDHDIQRLEARINKK